jgi:hypothetical protein
MHEVTRSRLGITSWQNAKAGSIVEWPTENKVHPMGKSALRCIATGAPYMESPYASYRVSMRPAVATEGCDAQEELAVHEGEWQWVSDGRHARPEIQQGIGSPGGFSVRSDLPAAGN